MTERNTSVFILSGTKIHDGIAVKAGETVQVDRGLAALLVGANKARIVDGEKEAPRKRAPKPDPE